MNSPMAFLLTLLAGATSVIAGTTWTVNCEVLSIQRSDPIVNPGVAGGHVHAIVGGTAFNRSMIGDNSAVNTKATTCNKFTDHSNYWCPQLYHMRTDGMFDIVKSTGANFYYQNYTCSYNPSGICSTPRDAKAFPPGFRMLAGDSSRRTQNDSDITHQAILYTSGTAQNVYGIPKTLGTNFQAVVRFPSCWDGKTVDSPNHKTHVAYPDPNLGGNTEGGMCPSTHPIALISIGAEFGFDIAALGITDPKSLVFANGDTTGYGFHGDFVQGWTNLTALENSFANCFSNDNCPWRAFGSPDGKDIVPVARSPEIPAPFEEEIGLNGPIAKLPGNNPVYVAPA